MPTYIRAISLPLLAVHFLVAGFLLGCRNDDWTAATLVAIAPTATENKISGREEPNRAILDSLVGFTMRRVKPFAGATLSVGTTSFTIPPGASLAPLLAAMPQAVFKFQPDELGTIDPGSSSCVITLHA